MSETETVEWLEHNVRFQKLAIPTTANINAQAQNQKDQPFEGLRILLALATHYYSAI